MAKKELNNLVKEMNSLEANLNVLYAKLHSYHYYMRGTGFFTLHVKFEEFYNDITVDLDSIAERLLIMGERTIASLQESLDMATLKQKN